MSTTLPEPNFVERDPQKITKEMVAQWEHLMGKTLYPAQVEYLFINLMAYRETLVRIAIQDAAKQNLLAYARYPILDELGKLLGCYRLEAQPAKVTLRFTLPAILTSNKVIPKNTRCSAPGSDLVFKTDKVVSIKKGELYIDVTATCELPGLFGNGVTPGQVITILSSKPTGVTVSNVDTSAEGSDLETDDHLRERIQLASESFTTAGSIQSYKYHAMGAHPSIIDVEVQTPDEHGIAGTVKLYTLTTTGAASLAIRNAVYARCSGEKVRPVCDTVLSLAPTPVEYEVEVEVTPYLETDPGLLESDIQTSLESLTTSMESKLGADIIRSQFIAASTKSGVYKVNLVSPAADVELTKAQWAKVTNITVTMLESVDG